MSSSDVRKLSNKERAEITKRKLEMSTQKNTKQASSLSELKRELGLPEKRTKT